MTTMTPPMPTSSRYVAEFVGARLRAGVAPLTILLDEFNVRETWLRVFVENHLPGRRMEDLQVD